MKKIFVASLLLLAIIIACTSSHEKRLILQKPGDAPADEYVIDTEKDTTLVTKNGALLKIPKGSLQNSKGNSVILEIKEAYTAEQMVRSGLTTRSDGELLSSGGMIYINAKAGQEVKITQPIRVALPADHLDSSMKLFKGEPDAAGNINWTNPVPLAENLQLKSISRGKPLFLSQCASCHIIGKDLVGPNLAHFLRRYSGDTLLVRGYALHRPFDFTGIEEGDQMDFDSVRSNHLYEKLSHIDQDLWINQWLYFCNLKARYGSLGTGFPQLDEAALTSIYQYIQNESDRRNLPVPVNVVQDDCIDSCLNYLKIKKELTGEVEKIQKRKDSLAKDNGGLTREERKYDTTRPVMPVPQPVIPTTPSPPVQFGEVVDPENKESMYYQFSIETLGWYNVDVLLKDWNGSAKSELWVRIMGEYRTKAEVFLIIPASKIYTKGGIKESEPDKMVFANKDGTIFLPQGVKSYILAVAETESSVAFTLKDFTTGLRQDFELNLQAASKEEFNQAIKAISAADISISVKDAKNAEAIRKATSDKKRLDSTLGDAEKLKPRNCSCDCNWGDGMPLISITKKDTLIMANK